MLAGLIALAVGVFLFILATIAVILAEILGEIRRKL